MSLFTKLRRWIKAEWAILVNAGSLVGTTAITSGLGFVYWWLAAHQFSTEAVGLASAAISAMTLLGTVGMLGLGTLLIGEFPRQPERTGALLLTALLVSGLAGFILGGLFVLIAPALASNLSGLSQGFGENIVFALGVSFTALTLVLDQALIGLLRGGMQLGRNSLFAVIKLVVLALAGTWLANKTGLTIYATWLVGNLVSLILLMVLVIATGKGGWEKHYRPRWGLLVGLKRAAVGHHILNLALIAPGMTLPVLVTSLLSASTNAHFYVAWMIANLVYVGPAALTTVLYAVGASNRKMLAEKIRLTLKLAALIGLVANVGLLFAGNLLLSLFGSSYAAEAEWSLRVLGLAVFAITTKDHFVAICRIRGQVGWAALPVAAGGVLEVACAAGGATMGGLPGLTVGWLLAMVFEAIWMAPAIYRAARYEPPLILPVETVEGIVAGVPVESR